MTAQQPAWETLNAYVDGELPAAEAAAVARALAEDRGLASQVATLSKLKAAVEDSVETAEISLPGSKPNPWRPLALAASLALAFVTGAWLIEASWQGPSQPAWLAEARAAHTAWTAAEDSRDEADSGVVLAAMHGAGPGAYLPDLSAAKLRLSRIETLRFAGRDRPALHVGYRGTRGCQVSLFIVPAAKGDHAISRPISRYDKGPNHAYVWRSRSHGYLLTATGMDAARLDLIAQTVRRASLEHSPFNAETRTALQESRKRSVPCLS